MIPAQYRFIFRLEFTFFPGVPNFVPSDLARLDGCTRNLRPKAAITKIVIHSTVHGPSFEGMVGEALNKFGSAHYYVDNNGKTVQIADDLVRLCQVEAFRGEVINDKAVGIEIMDYGPDLDARPDPYNLYALYPEIQRTAVALLTQRLIDKFDLKVSDVVRHKDVSDYKGDPYGMLDDDWIRFKGQLCDANKVCIDVARAGTGRGAVVSLPAGIQCAPTCVGTFQPNSQVSLVATPDSTSTFVGWGGDCPNVSQHTIVLMPQLRLTKCMAVFSSQSSPPPTPRPGMVIRSFIIGRSCPDPQDYTNVMSSCLGTYECSGTVAPTLPNSRNYNCPLTVDAVWTCGETRNERHFAPEQVNQGTGFRLTCPRE